MNTMLLCLWNSRAAAAVVMIMMMVGGSRAYSCYSSMMMPSFQNSGGEVKDVLFARARSFQRRILEDMDASYVLRYAVCTDMMILGYDESLYLHHDFWFLKANPFNRSLSEKIVMDSILLSCMSRDYQRRYLWEFSMMGRADIEQCSEDIIQLMYASWWWQSPVESRRYAEQQMQKLVSGG